MMKLTKRLSIREDELRFVASRSGGPGGQNVNKVETRVTLRFDVMNSPSLSADEKRLIRTRLATRINKDGVLRVVSQRHRSQAANRKATVERFAELLSEALRRAPLRKKTRIPRAVRERRLAEKKRRSRIKQERSKRFLADD